MHLLAYGLEGPILSTIRNQQSTLYKVQSTIHDPHVRVHSHMAPKVMTVEQLYL